MAMNSQESGGFTVFHAIALGIALAFGWAGSVLGWKYAEAAGAAAGLFCGIALGFGAGLLLLVAMLCLVGSCVMIFRFVKRRDT